MRVLNLAVKADIDVHILVVRRSRYWVVRPTVLLQGVLYSGHVWALCIPDR